ncbi:MAG: lipid asymmetry maintenance protein MlaB [Methylophilaceae bacterium]
MANIVQSGNRWEVSGDVEIDNANALLLASNALSISKDTVVDFANVTEIDTGAISLILEWKRRAIAENKQLKFVNLSPNLVSLTQLYGVAEMIN